MARPVLALIEMTRTFVLSCIGLTALVVNPFFACDPEPSFDYGELEMRAAVEGTWKLTIPDANAPAHVIALTVHEASGLQQHAERDGVFHLASACGTRSFIRNAGACMDVSEMKLEVTADAVEVKHAKFMVLSTTFERGLLELTLPSGTTVSGRISPTGIATDVSFGNYHATLVRVK